MTVPRAPLGRRRLVTLLALAGAWFCGRAGRVLATTDSDGLVAADRLVGLLEPSRAVLAVGDAYLRTRHRDGASLADLTGMVLRDIDAGVGEVDDPRALRRALRRRMASEFERGDMVIVDGWMLSATEARLYAVAALGAKRGFV